jgi:hypothetical protein
MKALNYRLIGLPLRRLFGFELYLGDVICFFNKTPVQSGGDHSDDSAEHVDAVEHWKNAVKEIIAERMRSEQHLEFDLHSSSIGTYMVNDCKSTERQGANGSQPKAAEGVIDDPTLKIFLKI